MTIHNSFGAWDMVSGERLEAAADERSSNGTRVVTEAPEALGFPPASSVQSRAEGLRGVLDVRSEPGEGTTVCWRIPL